MTFDKDKLNIMYISKNILNSNNVGTKFYIKTFVLDKQNQGNLTSLYGSANLEKIKNRVIFCNKIKNVTNNNDKYSLSCLTQNNFVNNIKLYFKNNNYYQPRILFIKQNINITNNQDNFYLFDNLSNFIFSPLQNTIYNEPNTLLNTSNYIVAKKYIIAINYYDKNNDIDFYNINLSDFVYKYQFINPLNPNNDICYNEITTNINNINLTNNFTNNLLINYNPEYFKKIYYNNQDISAIVLLDNNNTINGLTSIYLYNVLDNITSINLTLKYNGSIKYDNYLLDLFLIKKYDLNNINKILIQNNLIYFNTRVLGNQNNFYNINNIIDKENTIYLSFGNNITGLTQHDLYNHINFNADNGTIIFSNNIVSDTNVSSYKNNYFLLDNNYNYNYNNLLINIYSQKDVKNEKIALQNLYTNDIFNNYFNNIELLNNLNTTYFDLNTNLNNIIFNLTNITYNSSSYKLKINNVDLVNNINSILNKDINYYSNLEYDYRFNYGEKFYANIEFDILYKNNQDICNQTHYMTKNNNFLLNFNKVVVSSFFDTILGSDFTNVDCIFIYHDPEKETDPSFIGNNNNIEIIKNPSIDTLTKAIELLPGARTSTSNSTFIPARNGSNLSRKQIQGLIGLNNIPRLLSIQPYDPNFILGRGQTDTDNCLTFAQKVERKIETTTSNNNVVHKTRNKNFASIVNSRARNNSSQNCINSIQNNQIVYNKNNVYTPFKLFKTGKGTYLPSG